jgi:hypothetical protein
LKALDAVLSKSVVETIQTFLEVFEMEERLRSLDDRHFSSHGFPPEFHRSALRAIHGHILQLNKLVKRYDAANDWFKDYISACHTEMIREVRALSPLYPYGEVRLRSNTITKSQEELIRVIYSILKDALLSAGVCKGRKELSIQLTTVFCARFSSEAVRKQIERREQSRRRSSGIPS